MIVEIKARFDEEANIRWARKLEQAGCHVVYGLVGLKTHCKLSMVVRDEPEGIRRYTHIGTGNYNRKTARMYEDLGLITTNEVIGEDVAHLFNNLTGYSRNPSYERLLVAPDSVRTGLVERIHREIDHHVNGRPARIRIKANSVVDEAIIDALYLASQAGVPVEMLVRGICALRPGVPGLSENITVRSILGRFLEHSRVYWFENGGEPSIWIGSADLMHRNLDRRVEVLVQLPGEANVAAGLVAARPLVRAHDVRLDPGQRRRVGRQRRTRPPAGDPGREQAAPAPRHLRRRPRGIASARWRARSMFAIRVPLTGARRGLAPPSHRYVVLRPVHSLRPAHRHRCRTAGGDDRRGRRPRGRRPPDARGRARLRRDHPRDRAQGQQQLRHAVRPRGHLLAGQRARRRDGRHGGGRRPDPALRGRDPAGRVPDAGRGDPALRRAHRRGDAERCGR